MASVALDRGTSITIHDLTVDPYPIYGRLQREAPVSWVPAVDRWLVTGWDDVITVDTHPEIFSSCDTGSLMNRVMGSTMLRLDGEAHKRLRDAAAEPFKPRGGGINEPRDTIGTTVWGLLTSPDQLAAVLADPVLWRNAVEESVRWISPIGMYPREVAIPTTP